MPAPRRLQLHPPLLARCLAGRTSRAELPPTASSSTLITSRAPLSFCRASARSVTVTLCFIQSGQVTLMCRRKRLASVPLAQPVQETEGPSEPHLYCAGGGRREGEGVRNACGTHGAWCDAARVSPCSLNVACSAPGTVRAPGLR